MDNDRQWASLMAAAQGGDGQAYATLLRACVPLVRAVVARAGVAPAMVDDVIQEVLIAVHRARATYDPRYPFTPWLRTIAQRRAIDAMRGAGRRRAREVHAPDAASQVADPAPGAPSLFDAAEAGGRLRAAVAGLPEGQRQAVELLGLQELTLEEASARSGRTKTALKVNLHRAIKALRQILPARSDE